METISNRQNYAKKLSEGGSANVTEQRVKRRKIIYERLKYLRKRVIDNLRKIDPNGGNKEHRHELNAEILSSMDPKELVEIQEISDILDELKQENVSLELEEYEKQCMEEVESLTRNLLNKCEVCDHLLVNGNICDGCIQTHLSSQF